MKTEIYFRKWSVISFPVIAVLMFFIFIQYAKADLATPTDNQAGQKRQQKVNVKTLEVLSTKTSHDITSSFDGISQDAAAAGLTDSLLIGSVTSEKFNEDATRVRIVWHTLEKQKLGSSVREKLAQPLTSSVIVKVDEIPTDTSMVATGDISSVVAAFNTILEREQYTSDENTNQQQANEDDKKDDKDKPLRMDTGSAGNSATAPTSEIPTDDGIKAEVVPEDYQVQAFCGYRSDIPVLKMFKQVRMDTLDGATNEVKAMGKCEDSGEPIALSKKFGGDCSATPDIDNRVIYQGFRVTGLVDGFTQIVQDCELDLVNTLPLKATFSNCGVTDDFVNGESKQQERLYYMNNGTEVQVRGCENSTQAYVHTATPTGCDPIVDLPNGIVHPQTHIGYKDGQGKTVYITDCAITSGSSGIGIVGEECAAPNKYEHDFTNGQSYLMKRQYYNYNGEKLYLTSCGKSATSYPHLKFTQNCGVRYDDTNLNTKLMALTAINTPLGQLEIAPCELNNSVSYVYNGYVMKLYEKYSSQMKHVHTAGYQGMPNGWSYSNAFSWTTAPSTLTASAPFTACEATNANSNFTKYCNRVRYKYVAQKDYVRYDGTHFYKWDMGISRNFEARDN